MKKFWAGLAVILACLGCSKTYWLAKIHLVRAENAYSKAYALRLDKKVSPEERLTLYRQACVDFSSAYRHDAGAFTLYRIECAADACLRVEDFKAVESFRAFAEEYAQSHPQEVQYGDVGPWMTLEG
jgi:hypothetical protein